MGYTATHTAVPDDMNFVLASWMETDSVPRLIIDDFHSLIWCSPAASALLKASGAIELQGNTVHVVDPEQHARFSAHIHQRRAERSHLLLSDGADDYLWIQFDPVGNLCGLTLRATNNPTYADFRALFMLTSKEDAVLRLLLSGAVAETIAASCQVSIVTVRSHIRSIYSKMNVNSREALLAKASVYRIA